MYGLVKNILLLSLYFKNFPHTKLYFFFLYYFQDFANLSIVILIKNVVVKKEPEERSCFNFTSINFGQNSDKMTDNFIQGVSFFDKINKGNQTAVIGENT